MKTNQKGLQKFTNLETKIAELFELDQITKNDIKQLNDNEISKLNSFLTETINKIKGLERDLFIRKIEPLLDNTTKNQLWEMNHNQITAAISDLMQEYNRMPSKAEIAIKTELSRPTIHKHLKEYMCHPIYLQQIEQFRFMTSKVLAKVFKFAVNGDMSAAKLYFNVIGNITGSFSNNTLIQNQNNYIQINGTVLSQETIKRLNPDQLTTIENILKTAQPQAAKLEAETF